MRAYRDFYVACVIAFALFVAAVMMSLSHRAASGREFAQLESRL